MVHVRWEQKQRIRRRLPAHPSTSLIGCFDSFESSRNYVPQTLDPCGFGGNVALRWCCPTRADVLERPRALLYLPPPLDTS